MQENHPKNNIVKNNRISFAEQVKDRKYFNRRNIVCFCVGAFVAVVAVAVLPKFWGFWEDEANSSLFSGACEGKNVGVIGVVGDINYLEYSEYQTAISPKIVAQIRELEDNPNIKGMLINIESGGGETVSSESIMSAIRKSAKPTAAVIQNIGASGAYLAATGADRIFASKFSEVGSIGVTNDFLDISGQDKKNGVIFYDFSSGKYKGTGKDHSAMTKDQRSVIMEDIMKFHDVFVDYVSKNRNLPIEKVRAMATGRTYTGEDALELGLIDEIGGMSEAGLWLKESIGARPSYCFAKK